MAALESAGTVLGAIGMLAFALTFSLTVQYSIPTAFIAASLARDGRVDRGLVRPPQDADGAQVAGFRRSRRRDRLTHGTSDGDGLLHRRHAAAYGNPEGNKRFVPQGENCQTLE